MVNEESVLKNAIAYLAETFAEDGVLVLPKNQERPPSIPCITIVVSTSEAVHGINNEILATVRIHATVYASNVYAPFGDSDGVMTIFDKLNLAMSARHYSRINQTEPYRNAQYGVWNKDGYFTKKTNEF